MTFARINGWRVPIANESDSERRAGINEPGHARTGRPQRSRNAVVRSWDLETPPLAYVDAQALAALLDGRGHHFPFDLDAHAESGLGPDTVASGNWSISPRTFGPTGGGIHGAGYLTVTTSITWDVVLPRGQWTILYWRSASSRATANHVAVRSDGAKWSAGVRADTTATTELVVDEDIGAVALTAGAYDDLVILPWYAPDSLIEDFYRWSTACALRFHVPLLDDTARDTVGLFNGSITLSGTVQVSRAGGRVGGCIIADAASEVVTYAASAAFQVYGLAGCTFEAWVRPASAATAGAVLNHITGATGWDLDLLPNAPTGRIGVRARVRVGAGTAEQRTTTTDRTATLAAGEWGHLAATWEAATGQVQLHINGRPLARIVGAFTDWPASAATDDSAASLRVGNDSSGTAQVNARICGVRFNACALTDDELRDRYLAGIGGVIGEEPRPWSQMPRTVLAGSITGHRDVPVICEVPEQLVLQGGATPAPVEIPGSPGGIVVLATSLVTTDNATSYTTPAFTPEAGDLIVVVHTQVGQGGSDWLLGFSYTSVSDSAGGSYNEKYPSGAFDTYWGADFYFSGVFSQVRTAAAPASSMTVTLDNAGHTALGCTINVFLIKNPLYYGNAARRQAVFDNTHGTSDTPATPTLTFGSTTLASSVVLGYVGSRDPSPLSAPSGLVEYFNDAHAAQPCGAEIAAAMGWVGTVLTWGGSTIRYRAAALELYTTGVVPPAQPSTWVEVYNAPSWRNDLRRIRFHVDEVQQREGPTAPRALWSFALDEAFADGLSLARADGGRGVGTLLSAGTFRSGPYANGRARTIAAAVGDRVSLVAEHIAALGGFSAVTVVAWVRRESTAVERGVLCLRHATTVPKLELYLDSGVNVAVRARGASGDTTRTLAAGTGLTDTSHFHLVGCFVDVANDLLGVFLDDAGLAPTPVGFYSTGAGAFTSTAFSAESFAAESAIGVSGGIANPWSGDIASVAVYPGRLTAEQIHALWQMGRRGKTR